MENFIYSLNATLPLFLLVVLGYFLQKTGYMKQEFSVMCDKFIFNVTLPVTLFMNMYTVDLHKSGFNGAFTFYCFISTLFSIIGIWIYAKFYMKNKNLTGEFTQIGYRSSVAILSAAIIENVYGTPQLVPFMVIGSVPLYNFFAVLILTLESPAPEKTGKKERVINAFIKILTNPIIDGLLLGGLFAWHKIKMPVAFLNTLRQIARITNPLSLISLGIGFQGMKALSQIKLTALASVIKLLILPALFVPAAYFLGFRGEELLSILVMFGGPTTFSCYIMARNMGHEGVLTSSAVVLTTLLSPVTLTLEIFALKVLNLI